MRMPSWPLIDISGLSSRPLRKRSFPTRRYLRSSCVGRAKRVSSTCLSSFGAAFDGTSAFAGAAPSLLSALARSPSWILSDLSADAVGAASRFACRGHALRRSDEHTFELQSLMRISYAVFCLKQKTHHTYV